MVDEPKRRRDSVEPASHLEEERTVSVGDGTGGTESSRVPPVPAAGSAVFVATTRLETGREIARGGMGSIRQAADESLHRSVAVKLCDPVVPGGDASAVRRFVQEAQITGQLEHPNIVPVHQLAVPADGSPAFFTMKLIEGRTLAELIDERRLERPSARELEHLLRLFLRVCEAVAFAHSRGVIHCDLKPSNVMVGSHGQLYVMDWGCARIMEGVEDAAGREATVAVPDPVVDRPGSVVGTLEYMPPEQALGRTDLDGRADVFALGGILYRILCQHAPHEGGSSMEKLGRSATGEIRPPRAVAPSALVPAELERICLRALAPAAADRYATVEALADQVETFLRGGSWLTSRTYAAGSVIIREGEPGDEAYIITEGTCEVTKLERGRTVALRVMGPGTVFGETAVLTDQPRTATVTALEELTVLVATGEALDHEICFDSWTGSFVRALAERFRDLDSQMTGTRLIRAEGRVFGWLREYVVAAGVATDDGRFEAPLDRVSEDIEAEFGLTSAGLLELLERSSDMAMDEDRGVVSIRSRGASAARRHD